MLATSAGLLSFVGAVFPSVWAGQRHEFAKAEDPDDLPPPDVDSPILTTTHRDTPSDTGGANVALTMR